MGQMDSVLITGATGFLGGYLTELLTDSYRVYALGRNEARGKELQEMGAVFCRGDFTQPDTCERYFEGMDYVIHAGALSSAWGTWQEFYEANVVGTENVAALCSKYHVKRMIYLSSPSIYTETRDRFDIKEQDFDPKNRLNHYIRSKIMAEKILAAYSAKGLSVVTLRPRGLIGIGDPSLIPRILRANQKTGIPLFRQGNNVVDITCVTNVALACKCALEAPHVEGQAFNITNGEPMAFRAILEQLMAAIGETPRYKKLPFPLVYAAAAVLEAAYRLFRIKGEPALTRYTVCTLGFSQTLDISKAKTLLSYTPQRTLAETIAEYGRWWQENSRNE